MVISLHVKFSVSECLLSFGCILAEQCSKSLGVAVEKMVVNTEKVGSCWCAKVEDM